MTTEHVPVLPREVLEALKPRSGGRYVDGTLGGGGHAAAILEASAPGGVLLGMEADPSALDQARERLALYGTRATLVHANFRTIRETARARGFDPCDGIVLDLGLSSDQLAAQRGFSFQDDAPLDMRFDPSGAVTAAELLNHSTAEELADIFFHYGEEPRSRRLARVVVERRRAQPFIRMSDFLAAVERALGGRRGRIHPATRALQGLRIAVNDELDALKDGLRGAADVLAAGGRLAVISFHSLEDRIVKQFIRAHAEGEASPQLRAITRKPLVAEPEERNANPRSRSAKLRVAERLAAVGAS